MATTWHPTFRKPTLDDRGRGGRTEFTYDTSGNRLTRTVTDIDPPHRSRTLELRVEQLMA